MTTAGWNPDPTGQAELRYWDGEAWTEHVSNEGVQSTAPIAMTESASAPTPSGDAFAGLSGELVDGTYTEVEGAGPQKQNERLLRVRIQEPFLAKQSAMVAYQGAVSFAYQGGGVAKFIKKSLTGEGSS